MCCCQSRSQIIDERTLGRARNKGGRGCNYTMNTLGWPYILDGSLNNNNNKGEEKEREENKDIDE